MDSSIIWGKKIFEIVTKSLFFSFFIRVLKSSWLNKKKHLISFAWKGNNLKETLNDGNFCDNVYQME